MLKSKLWRRHYDPILQKRNRGLEKLSNFRGFQSLSLISSFSFCLSLLFSLQLIRTMQPIQNISELLNKRKWKVKILSHLFIISNPSTSSFPFPTESQSFTNGFFCINATVVNAHAHTHTCVHICIYGVFLKNKHLLYSWVS